MKLNKLTLVNFCQYASYTLDIDPGLIKVSGPNGSGKSNILRGLIYSFTGWCDPSWGTQTDLQKDDEVIPGYAELELSIEDEAYTLRRYTCSGAKFVDVLYKGKELYLKNRQRINAFLETYMGAPITIVAQLIWMRQGAGEWLLTDTPSHINQFLASIFDTKKLEDIREHLKNAASDIPKLRSDYKERAEEAQKKIQELGEREALEEKEKEVKNKLDEYKALLIKADQGIPANTRKKLEADYTANIAHLKEVIEGLEELPEVKDNLDEIKALLEANEVRAAEIRKAKSDLSMQILDRRKETEVLQKLIARIEQLEIPDDCELCGSKLKKAPKYRLNKISIILGKKVEDEITVKELYDNLALNLKEIQTWTLKLESLREEYTKIEERASELVKKKKEVEDWNQSRFLLENAKIRLSEFETKLSELLAKPVSDVSLDRILIESAIFTLEKDVKNAEQSLRDYDVNLALSKQVIEQCKQDRTDYLRNEVIRDLFSRARDILSQKRAQTRYINSRIDNLNDAISYYLVLSEMPFDVRLDKETHSFQYRMTDSEIWHQAGMLSGAQKTAAAIAIQMALCTSAIDGVPLLLLDETDAALSVENKFIATRMYRTLSNVLSGTNGTVLVISQSDAVAAECDKEVFTC